MRGMRTASRCSATPFSSALGAAAATLSAATLANGTQYRETYWYAPNVGPIEGVVPVMVSPGDVRRFRLTLRGYTLDGEL